MKVAISSDFFTALSKLPKTQMDKTIKMVNKFKDNPDLSGLNFEKIINTDNLYSIRVDSSYRCILLKPKKQEIKILLYVANHDDAYDWATNHNCIINSKTGSVQVIKVESKDKINKVEQKLKKHEITTFFSKFKEKDLKKIGVSEDRLEMVKQVNNEFELDEIKQFIPEEVYEGLYYLLAGDTVAEVFNYLYGSEKEEIDTQDFVSALENNSSKRRFYLVHEDDIELNNMLHAPLEKWRVFLHPTQRKLVENKYNGPVRILGGAGTGKTVVAMHRANFLAKKNPEAKILFTTFTTNLALDIKENLKKICDSKIMPRIEVINIDKWANDFLKSNGFDYRIIYEKEAEKYWEKALELNITEGFSENFFKEEWKRVIQPQSIQNLNDYIKASRKGRGTPLSRKQRKQIWEVFKEYRYQLLKNNLKEASDVMRDASILIKEKPDFAKKYNHIIVDEAQDMTAQAFKLIRTMVPKGQNDIFIVGDAHQRIYGFPIVLSQCGINIIGRGKKLKLNYRTTDEIRKWSISILKDEIIDDLDNQNDKLNDYKSLYHGPVPDVKSFESFEKELVFILDYINTIKKEDRNQKICIVARTHDIIESYFKFLDENAIKTILLTHNKKDDLNDTGVRLATMHRVKGLEFDHVIIAGANDGVVPLRIGDKSEEDLINKQELLKEKSLIFVSATRAKKSLLITSYGTPSEFLRKGWAKEG